ncbi:MAG TPA: type II toxin-antitoxin system MqsA family antitoxin [Spirochaetota bacterium]|nr:type II toxin-antitoxin system MqsA family antitoxin [Spirochaetota bacterium]HQO04335.1 type II toxin-antitoxin system MqsA family antitoxin [Spirochaetota bacterium]HQP49690.1 type II toxin-antitoxin system MqsA family antitoxin [Spirochaetota bacterium]
MKCHVCGADLHNITTDLPFKTGLKSIVIIKDIPVFQCGNCSEYLIDDAVMEKIDAILSRADIHAELEIFSYAA